MVDESPLRLVLTIEEVKNASKSFLDPDQMVLVQAGRLSTAEIKQEKSSPWVLRPAFVRRQLRVYMLFTSSRG